MALSSPQRSQQIFVTHSPTSLSPPTSPLSATPSTLTSHFVQALHDYLPSANADDSASCLFFKKGSIIEVFNRDDSGWWDGQCGEVRGWFPSNYVGRIGEMKRRSSDFDDENYTNEDELDLWHQRMSNHVTTNDMSTVSLEDYNTKLSTIQTRVEMARALLREDRRRSSPSIYLFNNGINTTLSSSSTIPSDLHVLIEGVSNHVNELVDACSNQLDSNIQLIVFQVVSSVRSVLTETNIVNKDSPLLKMYPELARQRKIVLGALSRLVIKGKELQQQRLPLHLSPTTNEDEKSQDRISCFAEQLLNEMLMFEKLLGVIPRQSSSSAMTTDSSTVDTRPNSMFHSDTPRSSVSSLGQSSVMSTNSISLRQLASEARYTSVNNSSTTSLIQKLVPTSSDKEQILQNILEHQAFIDELMGSLIITLERYLVSRHRATEMLETTRRAVESVRTFLSVVEHVCSNLSDFDHNRHASLIPEDPRLVTLVLTKESVYSAITNLVTAVRALTYPQPHSDTPADEAVAKDDFDHLQQCCENVVKTTNECAACIRACLNAQDTTEDQNQNLFMRSHMQEFNRPELSTTSSYDGFTSPGGDTRPRTLSMLGRKATSLHAIQQYRGEESSKIEHATESDNSKPTAEQAVDSLAVMEKTTSAPPVSSTIYALRKQSDPGSRHHRFKHTGSDPTLGITYKASAPTRTLTIDTNTVDTVVHGSVTTKPSAPSKLRTRAASVNNLHQYISASSSADSDTSSDIIIVKPSVSAAFPLSPHVVNSNSISPIQESHTSMKSNAVGVHNASVMSQLKLRRPRGLSGSSLRPTLSKSKSERSLGFSSTESAHEPVRLQKFPSWMTFSSSHSGDRMSGTIEEETTPLAPAPTKLSINTNTKAPITTTITTNNTYTGRIEPDYDFLKQYVFSSEEMLFNADGEVTGATLEALVRKLTLHEKSPDLIFTRSFFYNFRLFTEPAEFVRLLTIRFKLEPPSEPLTDEQHVLWTNRVLIPIRLRVYNVIKTWMETYFNYEQDVTVENQLMTFATEDMSKAMPGPAKRMIELIKRTFTSKGLSTRKQTYADNLIARQKSSSSLLSTNNTTSTVNNVSSSNIFSTLTLFDDHHMDSSSDKYPSPILNKSLRNMLRKPSSGQLNVIGIHVNDIDPIELARQVTIMENNLFCRIQANEMIGQEFKKKVGVSRAIHVKAMIQRSTQITSWVSESILNEIDAKKRSQVLKYWIKVGDACFQLNNYNTLMAIRSALDSTSINRLKKTWDCLSIKYKAMWEPIYRATDSQRNFAEYRQHLKTTVAPCLPFLGVYLTDMTFIDDGNADARSSPSGRPLINFDKYVKITRILNEIDQFQIPYKLLEVDGIQSYLKRTLESVEQDDQVFYARSLQREPKEEE